MIDEAPAGDVRSSWSGRRLRPQDVPWTRRLVVFAIGLLALVLATSLLVAPLPFSGQVALKDGDVAPADVVAPRQAIYVSEIQTQKLRDAAAAAVPDVFDPPQARIARQQLTLANQILTFIGSVRSDGRADVATRSGYVGSIKGLDLAQSSAERIVTMSDVAWDRIAGEMQSLLDQMMREEIRETNLADQRRRVPARVRLDLSDEDAAIVSQVVQNLLAPNSFYNATKTEERRQQARDRVEPATVTIERNEVILRAGDIVAPADLEALNALGLKQATASWLDLRTTFAILALLGGMLFYYLWRQKPGFWLSNTEPLLLALILLLFTFLARITVPAHAVLAYAFPYAALAMLLAVLIDLPVALVASVVLAMLVGWLTGSIELTAYALFGGLVGALKLRRGDHLSSFAWAAVFVVAANLLVLAAFRVAPNEIDGRGLAELAAAALANGLLTVTVALLGTYLLGALFGITTPLQLMEISRPTHPLLRQLLLKAPGTYHHTLIVSNMSERAVEAIGGDALLARVGAYYHDVGKTVRPYFFAENRSEGDDPHSRLDAYTSAQIIIDHVRDGVDLARKYRLPGRVIDFIPEHHGTTLVSYFYHAAVRQAGDEAGIDRKQFTYPGPKPRSRETAVTMLADCAEATVRARHPGSTEELSRIVAESIQARLNADQLSECALTLADLHVVQQAFVDVLRGIHHPRVTYPSDMRAETPPRQTEVISVPSAVTDTPRSA